MGIDLGGTKIEGIVIDDGGRVMVQRRVPTPTHKDYRAIIDTVGTLAESLEAQVETRCSIGCATPGVVSSKTGAMKNCNTTTLNGQRLAEDLGTRLAREVRIANDANCFALSEATDGAARGHKVVFGVIMGTGVGAGIILGGEVHDGTNAIAGEWGHTPLHSDGPRCYCNNHGCVEMYLSGPGLLRDYRYHGGTLAADSAAIVRTGADGSDPQARAAMQRYVNNFGRAMATVADILDPHIIVLGGGMSNLDILYDAGRRAVAERIFSDTFDTPIVRNKFGDSSGVRGAAWLW